MFSLDNMAIQYPHATVERVPVSMVRWLHSKLSPPVHVALLIHIKSPYNMLYSGVIPLLTLFLWAAAFQPGVHKAHVTILGLLTSLILSSFLADVVKNAVGRPRPDLIARCKPAKGTPEHQLVTIDVCTETNLHKLHDGWRSFPSGHSSFAFGGLGFLALYVLSFHSLTGAPLNGLGFLPARCMSFALERI